MQKLICRLALMGVGILFGAGCATVEHKPVQAGPSERDKVVQLQIFLDAHNFGPGVVDGRGGEFTSKAQHVYEQVMGHAPDAAAVVPYTTYTVTADDLGRIGTLAEKPEEMAKQKRLPYTSLVELIAERAHTTQAFVRELNPGVNVDTLAAGAVVRVPNVARPLRVANFPSAYPPSTAAASTRQVVVDLNTRLLRVIDRDKLIAVFPITPGSAEHPAPVGQWKIVGLVPWPWFRWDEGVLNHGKRTEVFYNLPPGVNGPVGILWAGTNRPGVGIHGTPSPETIGRSGSHGCIRLSNWDAATFYTLVPKGTPLTIR
jgi:lipoprotein-anchoring transpeptidase ErfK/SrfK